MISRRFPLLSIKYSQSSTNIIFDFYVDLGWILLSIGTRFITPLRPRKLSPLEPNMVYCFQHSAKWGYVHVSPTTDRTLTCILIAYHQRSRRSRWRCWEVHRQTTHQSSWEWSHLFTSHLGLVKKYWYHGSNVSRHLPSLPYCIHLPFTPLHSHPFYPTALKACRFVYPYWYMWRSTTSNEGRLKEQLVPFADDFPLLTAAEVREFELSGYRYHAAH